MYIMYMYMHARLSWLSSNHPYTCTCAMYTCYNVYMYMHMHIQTHVPYVYFCPSLTQQTILISISGRCGLSSRSMYVDTASCLSSMSVASSSVPSAISLMRL